MKYARITGWGKYVPERTLSNQELEKIVETSDEWIYSRTGIRERRIAASDETVTTMSVAASKAALAVAGLDPAELDLIIVGTSSPDYLLPAAASMIQHHLGAKHAAAFDLRVGCSGFVYALAVGTQFIATGMYRHVLVIGAEIISKFIDWQDRDTCVLFGDGAGAVVLQASEESTGLLACYLGSDGADYDALFVPGGGSKYPFCQEVLDRGWHHIKMDGKRVFRFAISKPAQAAIEALTLAGLSSADIALLIPHQANMRIVQSICQRLGLPEEKVFVNIHKYGNTSAASIPIALCEAVEEGRLHPGDHVLLLGFGAGLTWAAAVLRWGVPELSLSWLFSWDFIRERVRVAGVMTTARMAGAVLLATIGALFTTSCNRPTDRRHPLDPRRPGQR
ncbi:MAG: ketoacyl-ACP synthase III [Chloroflexi bacterium]|nr:ketoacyl-ACP synthase III [Chloroflexota bacterium]